MSDSASAEVTTATAQASSPAPLADRLKNCIKGLRTLTSADKQTATTLDTVIDSLIDIMLEQASADSQLLIQSAKDFAKIREDANAKLEQAQADAQAKASAAGVVPLGKPGTA